MTQTYYEPRYNVDQNNSGVIIDSALSYEEMERYRQQCKDEMAPQLQMFHDLWERVRIHLQDPIQDEGTDRFSGYTGHRVVTLPGRMGRCALGFHLLKIGSDDYRTITAYRRKIYAEERRRIHYTSDSLSVSSSDIISSNPNPRLDFQLGIASTWLGVFERASKG